MYKYVKHYYKKYAININNKLTNTKKSVYPVWGFLTKTRSYVLVWAKKAMQWTINGQSLKQFKAVATGTVHTQQQSH